MSLGATASGEDMLRRRCGIGLSDADSIAHHPPSLYFSLSRHGMQEVKEKSRDPIDWESCDCDEWKAVRDKRREDRKRRPRPTSSTISKSLKAPMKSTRRKRE